MRKTIARLGFLAIAAVQMTACGGGAGASMTQGALVPSRGSSGNGAPANSAQISVSASTNSKAITLTVGSDNSVVVTTGGTSHFATLSSAQTKALFDDLAQAQPLGNLPTGGPCAKSASFGVSEAIAVGDQVSPDLTCPGAAIESTLHADIAAILTALSL